MVPDSVDARILEEHLLRDKFYNLDYTTMSSSVTSRSGSSSLHAKLGYVYDFFVLAFILLIAGAALYVVLRAFVLIRRKSQADSTLLPLSSSATSSSGIPSIPSSVATSPLLSSPLSSYFGFISKMHGENRLRKD
ncbi:hypothetical protein V1525DRAFT_388380 [Lipomyces kononenkoae]|uniref:Uncharacterized protein n=1 Tax=Lipomyces kononenkoae TaxID=34357 RepID=A0ACC3T150_LIPKO